MAKTIRYNIHVSLPKRCNINSFHLAWDEPFHSILNAKSTKSHKYLLKRSDNWKGTWLLNVFKVNFYLLKTEEHSLPLLLYFHQTDQRLDHSSSLAQKIYLQDWLVTSQGSLNSEKFLPHLFGLIHSNSLLCILAEKQLDVWTGSFSSSFWSFDIWNHILIDHWWV